MHFCNGITLWGLSSAATTFFRCVFAHTLLHTIIAITVIVAVVFVGAVVVAGGLVKLFVNVATSDKILCQCRDRIVFSRLMPGDSFNIFCHCEFNSSTETRLTERNEENMH